MIPPSRPIFCVFSSQEAFWQIHCQLLVAGKEINGGMVKFASGKEEIGGEKKENEKVFGFDSEPDEKLNDVSFGRRREREKGKLGG